MIDGPVLRHGRTLTYIALEERKSRKINGATAGCGVERRTSLPFSLGRTAIHFAALKSCQCIVRAALAAKNWAISSGGAEIGMCRAVLQATLLPRLGGMPSTIVRIIHEDRPAHHTSLCVSRYARRLAHRCEHRVVGICTQLQIASEQRVRTRSPSIQTRIS